MFEKLNTLSKSKSILLSTIMSMRGSDGMIFNKECGELRLHIGTLTDELIKVINDADIRFLLIRGLKDGGELLSKLNNPKIEQMEITTSSPINLTGCIINNLGEILIAGQENPIVTIDDGSPLCKHLLLTEVNLDESKLPPETTSLSICRCSGKISISQIAADNLCVLKYYKSDTTLGLPETLPRLLTIDTDSLTLVEKVIPLGYLTLDTINVASASDSIERLNLESLEALQRLHIIADSSIRVTLPIKGRDGFDVKLISNFSVYVVGSVGTIEQLVVRCHGAFEIYPADEFENLETLSISSPKVQEGLLNLAIGPMTQHVMIFAPDTRLESPYETLDSIIDFSLHGINSNIILNTPHADYIRLVGSNLRQITFQGRPHKVVVVSDKNVSVNVAAGTKLELVTPNPKGNVVTHISL